MANYGKVRYIESYLDAPASAEYIFRADPDGEYGVLQQYTDVGQINLYTCLFERLFEDKFKAMLVEVRKHMPADKLLYVEKPEFMLPSSKVMYYIDKDGNVRHS